MACKIEGPALVIQGEDRDLILKIEDENDDPFVLTPTPSEINAKFKATLGGCVSKTFTGGDVVVISEAAGKIKVTLAIADTDLLLAGEELDFQVDVTISGKLRTAKFKGLLTVEEKVC